MAKKPQGIKQIWFVSPIAVESDPNKTSVFPLQGQEAQNDEIQPAQPRGARNNELRLDAIRTTSGDGDFGFAMARNNVVTMAWNSKKAAEEYAKQQAAKTPKVAYGVFSCVDVFETTEPVVIEKKFNDQGELVIIKEEKNETESARSI